MSDSELETFIANHQNNAVGSKEFFAECLREKERRLRKLDFNITIQEIMNKASSSTWKSGSFVTYKDICTAHNIEWSIEMRWKISKHLGSILEYCFARGLPALTAVVVNKSAVTWDGLMFPSALEGFIKSAQRAGYDVGSNHERFLKTEQARVHEWARRIRRDG